MIRRKPKVLDDITNWRWRQSSANLSLVGDSLLSGKIQGISADWAQKRVRGPRFPHHKSDR